MTYTLIFKEGVVRALEQIADKRIQAEILEKMERLAEDPEKQGKALAGPLKGYRSVRAVGQRYRILYRIAQEKIVVVVVFTGIRKDGDKKDVYHLAQKLLKAGILES